MVSESTRKTVILSVSAVVGIAAISSLAYLLIQDDRNVKHQRKIRSLQKALGSKLQKVETAVQELIDGDIRLAQVRTKTLRTHRLYPEDDHVQLPSLGLIQDEDKAKLGADIEETKDELIRERTQGFEDPAKVRAGYKKLDFLIKAVNEDLLRLLESLDTISPRELTDIGDGFGGIALANGPEMVAFEKVRKRKRSDIAKIQTIMTQMDHIGASIKGRLVQIEDFEKQEEVRVKAEAEAKTAAKAEEDAAKVKEGVSFADVASHNIEEPEILAPTEDLEKMKEGISFAEVASHNIEEPEVLAPTEDLEKMKEGVSFAEVASHNIEEPEVLAPTEDLEKMKEGVSFAEVASHNIEEPEVLAQTEDLEKMKEGVSFADVASHNIEEPEVLTPTEDLEKMKEGVSFADVVAEDAKEEVPEEALEEKPTHEHVVEGVSFADAAAA